MIEAAKAELLEALRARDRGTMSLEELKLYADILKVLSDVSDTNSMDVLAESMKFMAEAMKDAAAPLAPYGSAIGVAM